MSTRYILNFLQQLQQHNSKAWMDAHREEYLQAKTYFQEAVGYLIAQLQLFDPALHGITVQESVFRINKNDFSKKGEAPYKGHFGAGISPGGRHSPYPNYVLLLEPGKSRIGGGIRKPSTKQLELIREEIDYSPGVLRQLLEEPTFKATFGELRDDMRKQPPKGFDKTHPELELLKHNGFQVLHYFRDEEVTAPDFLDRLPPMFRQVKPLHDFLNTSLTEL
ncbi:DUF2461 domain-containing protein [Pontibacter actiniarum]|uniref:TIGR02453 family protein n=1 Tax=Pontibacter actiniarum TaxID=323450 RepID=A0A1X9YTQ7_9BACT|nr:DUF2461 domain-containing protein [Pontibacter actiniarum]ARS36238.1 TIGR02453 family protein [Pontibacter actiniarum]